MSVFRRVLGAVAKGPGVRTARRGAGAFAAPHFRDHITSLYETDLGHNHRITELERKVDDLRGASDDLQRHLPEVLNAIASTHGIARLLRREIEHERTLAASRIDDLEALLADLGVRTDRVEQVATDIGGQVERLDGEASEATVKAEHLERQLHEVDGYAAKFDREIERLDGHVRDELWPMVERLPDISRNGETLAWLVQRVETVRAEMMQELRYGQHHVGSYPTVETEIVNPAALVDDGEGIRVNLGCGHIPIEGYANVDMRKLPGVDIVALAQDLPFEPSSVAEIYSAHTLEHFPEAELERTLLPYWFSLLRPGGTFRVVVPDMESMISSFTSGELTFETLREVMYGGQEYGGDYHFNGFTTESLGFLLTNSGFKNVSVSASGRPNGACLEFEMVAERPE